MPHITALLGSDAPHGTDASLLPPQKNDVFLYSLKMLFKNVPVLFWFFWFWFLGCCPGIELKHRFLTPCCCIQKKGVYIAFRFGQDAAKHGTAPV